MGQNKNYIKVYTGYGHTDDLVLHGHVLKNMPAKRDRSKTGWWRNMLHLLRLFFVKPVPGVKLQLQWNGQLLESTSEADGFFKFEWKSDEHMPAGWYDIQVTEAEGEGESTSGFGRVCVPHVTQYAFISDVDDTVMISHSATILKRLAELFGKNAARRLMFPGIVPLFDMLSTSHADEEAPNPFFYVSSSEWNLFDYLQNAFEHNGLPQGVFMLSQLKQWYELIKTGKTKHEGKLLRIMRILTVFPLQQFVLFGDNSQKDPFIYESIANKYPGKIYAIYIRNVRHSHAARTEALLSRLSNAGINTCQFSETSEALEHAQKIGLISSAVKQPVSAN